MKRNKKWAKISITLTIAGVILISIPIIADVYYGVDGGDSTNSLPDDTVETPVLNNNLSFEWPLLCEILGFVCFIGSMFSSLKYKQVI